MSELEYNTTVKVYVARHKYSWYGDTENVETFASIVDAKNWVERGLGIEIKKKGKKESPFEWSEGYHSTDLNVLLGDLSFGLGRIEFKQLKLDSD